MKPRINKSVTQCLAVIASFAVSAPAVYGQTYPSVQVIQNSNAYPAAPINGQQELDQMLAPIALYPDSLLTQILMASTYPAEVVQAAQWSADNPGMTGDRAVRAVQRQNWDPSVKSLVAFPQILAMMEGSMDWTERLGDAFLSQEPQIWDTVQQLRERADAAGYLQSSDQIRIEQNGPTYLIESARPDVIYVPYYDPLIVYGEWWWPGYAPMRWSPWSGYYSRSNYSRGFYWDNGISVGSGFFFGGIDWRRRQVNVINRNSFYYRNANRRPVPGNGWQHDPAHRHGVPYRSPDLRQQFNYPPGSRDTRGDYRGRQNNLPVPPTVNTGGQRGDQGDRGDRGDRRQPRPPQGNSAPPVYGAAPAPQQMVTPTPVQTTPQDRGNGRRQRGDQPPQALEVTGRGDDARNAGWRSQANSPRPPVAAPPVQPQLQTRAVPQPPRVQQTAPASVPPAVNPNAQRESREQREVGETPTPPGNVPRERGRGEQQK